LAAKMKVLVTGATGFVGAEVTRALLRAGHAVHVLARDEQQLGRIADLEPEVTVHRGDLLNAASVWRAAATARADMCVHLAWYAVPEKYLHAHENVPLVLASVELAKAVAAHGAVRFVGAGTCIEYDVYALQKLPSKLVEGVSAEAPRTLYAVCKYALWGMLRELGPSLGLEVAWARLFFLYGPNEAPGRLVSEVLTKLLRGSEAPVSAGEQVRDFLHVKDVARALCMVLESPLTGVVNIGSGVPVRVRDVVEAMGAASGRPDLIRYGAKPSRAGDPASICADTARLRSAGFLPQYDLQEGIADAAAYWRAKAIAR
jgi:UDP-glucuronate decarboxylase